MQLTPLPCQLHSFLSSCTSSDAYVRDAQDITTLVLNIGHNFVNGMTEQTLLERTQSIHKEDFKFGTDNYLWITKVDLNR